VITLVRVDERLIHGQVVEGWLPHLKVQRVTVADDEAAQSPLIRAAMGLAIGANIEVQIGPVAEVPFAALSEDAVKTLVLLRDVPTVLDAQSRGLDVRKLNLGNVHFADGRRQVSPSVFLTDQDLEALEVLSAQGVEVDARGVPTDKPISVLEMLERFGKAGPQPKG
jgi:mannose/fructose/N-acetylgalactosamine-specific phosphotransferase system component IIB